MDRFYNQGILMDFLDRLSAVKGTAGSLLGLFLILALVWLAAFNTRLIARWLFILWHTNWRKLVMRSLQRCWHKVRKGWRWLTTREPKEMTRKSNKRYRGVVSDAMCTTMEDLYHRGLIPKRVLNYYNYQMAEFFQLEDLKNKKTPYVPRLKAAIIERLTKDEHKPVPLPPEEPKVEKRKIGQMSAKRI